MTLGSFEDPRDFLAAIMRNDECDTSLRLRAAGMLLANELAVERFKVQLIVEEDIGPRWGPNSAAVTRNRAAP